MKVNTALIGFGYFGKIHYKYLNNLKKINLKIICIKKNIGQKSKIKKPIILTTNKKLILNDKKIKFVDIVTPIDTHASEVISFLKSGKKVLCEKPLILDKNEEKKIKNLLKKNKNALKVSYPYLFSKSLNKSKELINNKNFGKIKFIKIQILQPGRFNNYDVFNILGPHAISMLSIFFDTSKIKFKKNSFLKYKNICESGIINCFMKNKFISSIDLSTNFINKNKEKKVIIFCENGTIICDLETKKNNIEATVYSRKKENSYFSAILKKTYNYSFDEKNNIKHVIKDVFNNNNNKNNFLLTLNINKFLKQKINYE